MQKQILRLLLLIIVLAPQLIYGQAILAPNADLSDTTQYGGDSLFVFNVDNNSAYIIADTQSYPTHTIEWHEHISGSGYQLVGTSARIDIDMSVPAKAYRLTLTGSPTIVSTCWVLINDFSVEILTKDENDTISKDALTSGDCIWIGYIMVAYSPDPLSYYDPVINDSIYTYTLSYTSSDSTDQEIESGVGDMYEADGLNGMLRYAIDNSWWEDAKYTIIITDETGLERSDFLYVTAIRPRAIFEDPEHIYLNNNEFYPDRDTLYYTAYDDTYNESNKSAPGLYRFTSESFNADSLIWNFGDLDSINTSQTEVVHQYTKYGTYEVGLTVVNYFDFRRECSHISDKQDITLSVPSLLAPNVFSPPGGEFPIWRYEDVSITDFEIAVYNRYGRRVHYFEGNVRDWGGWDGSLNNSSNYVSTGVYFYVLKDFSHASPFDEEDTDNLPTFEDAVYSGSIHVFNTDQ